MTDLDVRPVRAHVQGVSPGRDQLVVLVSPIPADEFVAGSTDFIWSQISNDRLGVRIVGQLHDLEHP